MGNGFLDDLPNLELPAGRKTGPPPDKKIVPLKGKNLPVAGPLVIYSRVKCPRCKSDKVPVYDSSHLPIRYHKCKKCGLNFKSIEKSAIGG